MFSQKPVISFRSARKLSSYLLKAKLYRIQRTVTSFKCTKKRCKVCQNVNITDSFTFSVTQNTCKISHKLTCDDKCITYCLTSKQCRKQYVGAADSFRKRCNNYKNNVRKFLRRESCIQQHLFEHFHSSGHTGFVEYVCITLKMLCIT